MGDIAQTLGMGEPQLAENQEVSHTTYSQKLSNSMCGMCIGFILFFGSLATSAWNEYNNVATQKTIQAAQNQFKEGSCTSINPNLEGELVYISCPLSNLAVLGSYDPVLQGIPEAQRKGISLESYMEVYQWKESTHTKTTDNKVGGGSTTVKTYTYSRNWGTNEPPSITSFNRQGESCKSENGGRACLNWNPSVVESWWSSTGYSLGTHTLEQATNVQVGNYTIPNSELHPLGVPTVLTPACSNSSSVKCAPGSPTLKGTKLYWQQQDSNGVMMDYLTRSYTIYSADTVSILAEQRGKTFVKWTSPYDDSYYINVYTDGTKTASELLAEEDAKRKGVTWFLRFFTLILCIVGLVMITAPLAQIPDIIPLCGPFLGDLIGSVLWVVDCMLGCCCWSFVAAMSWISFRPSVGIPLLCVSILLCAGGIFAAITHKGKRAGKTPAGEEPDNDMGKVEEEADIEVGEEYNPVEAEPVEVVGEIPDEKNPSYNPDYKG